MNEISWQGTAVPTLKKTTLKKNWAVDISYSLFYFNLRCLGMNFYIYITKTDL